MRRTVERDIALHSSIREISVLVKPISSRDAVKIMSICDFITIADCVVDEFLHRTIRTSAASVASQRQIWVQLALPVLFGAIAGWPRFSNLGERSESETNAPYGRRYPTIFNRSAEQIAEMARS